MKNPKRHKYVFCYFILILVEFRGKAVDQTLAIPYKLTSYSLPFLSYLFLIVFLCM